MKIKVSLDRSRKELLSDERVMEKLLSKTFATILSRSQLRTQNVKKNLSILSGAKELTIDLLITGDREVRALNKKFRKLDKTTDVLSFSTADAGLVGHSRIHLGDIIISTEMVQAQAIRFGVSEKQELNRLVVHGFLHLLGFDHVQVSARLRAEMRAIEDAVLGIPLRTPQSILTALEKKFQAIQPKHPPGFLDRYVGGGVSSQKYLGLSVPQVRFIVAEYADQELDLKTLSYLFKSSNIFEVKSFVFVYLERHIPSLTHKKLFSLLKSWVQHIDNWALSDSLSSIYARCLEQEPRVVLPVLKGWNKHPKEWFIRQSLVSLFYYASQRKKVLPFATCTRLITPHLRSRFFYVQKAVGWTLRELYNVYPKETEKFIARHIKDIRGYAFSAATEKMSKQQKEVLKKLKR